MSQRKTTGRGYETAGRKPVKAFNGADRRKEEDKAFKEFWSRHQKRKLIHTLRLDVPEVEGEE